MTITDRPGRSGVSGPTARRRAAVLAGFGLLAAGPATALNDCLPGAFVDRRGLASIEIANDDPTNPFRYRPRCVTVSEGTRVLFRGLPNFGMHPLFGGTVANGQATIDPASPIGAITSGSQAERLLTGVAQWPFFCDFHYDQGMLGSILVVPELFADGFELPDPVQPGRGQPDAR
jgi:plastocyanin